MDFYEYLLKENKKRHPGHYQIQQEWATYDIPYNPGYLEMKGKAIIIVIYLPTFKIEGRSCLLLFPTIYTSQMFCVSQNGQKIFISPSPACNLIQNSPDYYCFKKKKIVPLPLKKEVFSGVLCPPLN